MTHRTTLILRAVPLAFTLALTAAPGPARAAFFFEGLAPFMQSPDCNDPHARTCTAAPVRTEPPRWHRPNRQVAPQPAAPGQRRTLPK